MENNDEFKRLSVKKGISQPDSVSNDSVISFLSKKRKLLAVDEYVDGIRSGNIAVLSKAVTLVESAKPAHQEIAQQIIMKCLPFSGHSIRIGITGVPGVGKSLFIEALGKHITGQHKKLAVLAIDPSSERSKGSILGDKTRMEELAGNPLAYIRPSPSAGTLGGVARKTRETIILCEAAGYSTVIIETVGVGQSETAVRSMTDFFLLLMLAGAGDELQGIKRGIMEMANALAINKADGDNAGNAALAKTQYENALHLFPQSDSKWEPRVFTCSALKNQGITDIWEAIEDYRKFTEQNGYFFKHRNEQSLFKMYETVNDQLQNRFFHHPEIVRIKHELEQKVLRAEISSFAAARMLLDIYHSKSNYSG